MLFTNIFLYNLKNKYDENISILFFVAFDSIIAMIAAACTLSLESVEASLKSIFYVAIISYLII